jgi:hypothetical protein
MLSHGKMCNCEQELALVRESVEMFLADSSSDLDEYKCDSNHVPVFNSVSSNGKNATEGKGHVF